MKKFDRTRYLLDKEQEQAILDYLWKKITLRELGEILEMSHQGAKDMLPKTISDWLIDGKYKLVKQK